MHHSQATLVDDHKIKTHFLCGRVDEQLTFEAIKTTPGCNGTDMKGLAEDELVKAIIFWLECCVYDHFSLLKSIRSFIGCQDHKCLKKMDTSPESYAGDNLISAVSL